MSRPQFTRPVERPTDAGLRGELTYHDSTDTIADTASSGTTASASGFFPDKIYAAWASPGDGIADPSNVALRLNVFEGGTSTDVVYRIEGTLASWDSTLPVAVPVPDPGSSDAQIVVRNETGGSIDVRMGLTFQQV